MTANAQALSELARRLEGELVCPLKEQATKMVFGKGNPQARIVFIGEAPGREEDLQGEPFVGRAGKELDKLLCSINLRIDDVYICNILKFRPPLNRDPSSDEIRSHTPYLLEQLSIIRPEIIIPLGNYATKFVLAGFDTGLMKTIAGISSLHGRIHRVRLYDSEIRVMPMFHPAAMLYKPDLRMVMYKDFKQLCVFLDEHSVKCHKHKEC